MTIKLRYQDSVVKVNIFNIFIQYLLVKTKEFYPTFKTDFVKSIRNTRINSKA